MNFYGSKKKSYIQDENYLATHFRNIVWDKNKTTKTNWKETGKIKKYRFNKNLKRFIKRECLETVIFVVQDQELRASVIWTSLDIQVFQWPLMKPAQRLLWDFEYEYEEDKKVKKVKTAFSFSVQITFNKGKTNYDLLVRFQKFWYLQSIFNRGERLQFC